VNRALLWIGLLSLLLVSAVMVSLCIGPERITPGNVLQYLTNDVSDSDAAAAVIVRKVRLPRVLLALTIGIGLAAAGTGYQGLFRNPLADPFIIGASSGAAFGAAMAISQNWSWELFSLGPIFFSAMLGAIIAVAIVYGIASTSGRVPTTELLLAGVAVGSFFSAMVSLIMYQNQADLFKIMGWLMGSVSGRGWLELRAAAPIVLFGSIVVWGCSRGLDALTFGEESASSLGIRLNTLRGVVVIAASLTTAAAVAAGGIIGFVGLIAPHIARLLVGARHAVLLPASCLTGGLLLLLADDVARTAVSPRELPIGVVTAFFGGPFFLYLLKSRGRKLELGG
jgi:iron complex transport system permease protein